MSVKKILLQYLKSHKLFTAGIVGMIALVTVLSLLPAQILRIIVDGQITLGKTEALAVLAVTYGFSYVLIGVATFFKDYLLLSAGQKMASKLRLSMMKHVHGMTYNSLVDTDTGTVENYFSGDVNAINELFTGGVIGIVTDSVKIIGIIVTIFVYSLIFGGIVTAVLPIVMLLTAIVRKGMLKAQLKTKSQEGGVNKTLLESVENIEQIKVNKAEGYVTEKYDGILKNHFRASQRSNFYDSIFPTAMQIIKQFVVISVLLVSGYDTTFFGMSVGMVISAISLITDLFTPIDAVGMEIQTVQKSVASVKRINSFLLSPTERKNDCDTKGFAIKYDRVSFAYDDRSVIEDFSLEIKEGERVAFRGVSGAGKSTLMRLAMGIVSPTKGRVTVGGTDAALLSEDVRRRLFSVVYQDPFFSGGTVYEEISLLDEKVTEEDVRRALDRVGLNYVTELSETLNPNSFSSGELALLNIARVVARNASVIFLDEMNAKIDPVTAKQIITLIDSVTEGKTVLSINHYGDTLSEARVVELTKNKFE